MARIRKKAALYEAMSRTRSKLEQEKTVKRLHPEKSGGEKVSAANAASRFREKISIWPKRRRMVQFTAGRIEISVPYQVGIMMFLGAILVVLVTFRFGQISYLSSQSTEETVQGVQEVAPQVTTDVVQRVEPAAEIHAGVEIVEAAEPKGNNHIVIVEYRRRADLEPVKLYFSAMGIKTEIIRADDRYYLRSMDKYENPGKTGTDGYYALKKIREVGAGYKAPLGYETFGKKPFQDAYGKRFGD